MEKNLKETYNDLPIDPPEDDERLFEYYALTLPVNRSVSRAVRSIKRAAHDVFEHIIITYETHPYPHCHALLAGWLQKPDLDHFGFRLSNIKRVWVEQLKTSSEVKNYRDYIMAINRHENKAAGTLPAYFKNEELFFNLR